MASRHEKSLAQPIDKFLKVSQSLTHGRIILKAVVEREKPAQAIDVHGEWTNCVVTL